MVNVTRLNTQQVGKCGELFVQYQLLKHGVESAPMTTDSGIDLMAMHPTNYKAVTIQVKTASHRDGGSGGENVLWDWANKGKGRTAQYIAVVDLERDKGWLLKKDDFEGYATGSDHSRLWWYIPGNKSKKPTIKHHSEADFAAYEMDTAISGIFSP